MLCPALSHIWTVPQRGTALQKRRRVGTLCPRGRKEREDRDPEIQRESVRHWKREENTSQRPRGPLQAARQRGHNDVGKLRRRPAIPPPQTSHSRMPAGQEAELGHVQAPSGHTQAVKPVLQADHQGPQGWGQRRRVPCEERVVGGPPRKQPCPHQLPSRVSPILASYLSSRNPTRGCPRPPDAGTRVPAGWPSAGHSPSTAVGWDREEGRGWRGLTSRFFPVPRSLSPFSLFLRVFGGT